MYNIRCFSFSEQCRRKSNEDALYYRVDKRPAIFTVCDGVGGAAYGEIASRQTCDAIAEYFGSPAAAHAGTEGCVPFVEKRLADYVSSHPGTDDMATTLTLLLYDDARLKALHVGDSRIYHLRNSGIAFRTKDHSLLSEMIEMEKITADEAKDYPMKNVITRAIRPQRTRFSEPGITELNDIQQHDVFLLCSDGVMEAVDEDELISMLCARDRGLEERAERLRQRCMERSRDNSTAIILEFE